MHTRRLRIGRAPAEPRDRLFLARPSAAIITANPRRHAVPEEGQGHGGRARGSRASLWGRADELDALRARLDAAREGAGSAVVIAGEPGSGKSTLLEVTEDAARGFAVLRASGIEAESDLPFAGLHQLLGPVVPLVDRVPKPQARALRVAFGLEDAPAPDRYLVSLGVLSLLAERADSDPVLCLVDDVQWLDGASLQALQFVSRRLHAEPVMVVLSGRAGEAINSLADHAAIIELGGLDVDAGARLLGAGRGVPVDRSVAAHLVAATGGNALALVELGGELSGAQLLGTDPLPDPLPVTTPVERRYVQVLRRLSWEAQTLLSVAAADDTGRLDVVLGATSRLGSTGDVLDECRNSGLVHTRGGDIWFRHSLMRSAVYEAVPRDRRVAAHHALRALLEQLGDADRAAWHRAVATFTPDAGVANDLHEAAQRAMARGAYAVAWRAYARSADLTPDPTEHAQRVLLAGEAARHAGILPQADSILERGAAATDDPEVRAEINRLQALIQLGAGSAQRACELLLAAARSLQAHDRHRAMDTLILAGEAASLGREDRLTAEVGQLAQEWRRQGGDDLAPIAAQLAGVADQFAGHVGRSVRTLRTISASVPKDGDATALLMASRAAIYAGAHDAALEYNARAVQDARDRGAIAEIPVPGARMALMQILLGRWAAGAVTAEEVLRLSRETGQLDLSAHSLAWLALVAALKGDETSRLQLTIEAAALASRRPNGLVDDGLRWIAGIAALADADWSSAFDVLASISHPAVIQFASLDRVVAAARSGKTKHAHAWSQWLDDFAAEAGQPWADARAAHARSLISDDAAAEGQLREALSHHVRSDRPFDAALTELALGEHLRRHRQRAEAREHLRVAEQAFSRLGAAKWVERALAELAGSGERLHARRGPAADAALTAQERQVAEYVSRGLSNREVAAQLFLSPRTIEFHLRNVYAKLGINSRSQLVHRMLGEA